MIYLQDSDFTLYQGDALEVLRTLPDESVHMCVTSPPFYGLRDYGTGSWEGGDAECDHRGMDERSVSGGDGKQYTNVGSNRVYSGDCKCGARRIDQQIGLEETPEQWVQKLVEVFREVRRVLRRDGTLWLEVGDSYARNGGDGRHGPNAQVGSTKAGVQRRMMRVPEAQEGSQPAAASGLSFGGLKEKDLIGAPWLLAFVLRADGWYLRSDIIWSRPNPMPESVTDRPTKSHSYVFLLSKSARYYWDAEALRENGADTPGRTNGAASSGSTLRPEAHAAFLTDDGAADTWGWCDLGQSEPAVVLPMAEQAERFQVLQPIGLQVGIETAEGPLVVDLESVGDAATDAPLPVALKRSLALLGPVWASVVDATAAPSGAVLATPPGAEPSAGALTRAEVVRLDLAAVSAEHAAALVTLDLHEGRATLLVWGTTGTAHPRNTSVAAGRNCRSVWSIPTQPYAAAHFATYPEELVRRCILAGTSERGCCPECGAPWVREVERTAENHKNFDHGARTGGAMSGGIGKNFPDVTLQTLGWRPSCECKATWPSGHGSTFHPAPIPCTVLDPFSGSGTTALVARKHGRKCIGIELSADYCALTARRLQQLSLLAEA